MCARVRKFRVHSDHCYHCCRQFIVMGLQYQTRRILLWPFSARRQDKNMPLHIYFGKSISLHVCTVQPKSFGSIRICVCYCWIACGAGKAAVLLEDSLHLMAKIKSSSLDFCRIRNDKCWERGFTCAIALYIVPPHPTSIRSGIMRCQSQREFLLYSIFQKDHKFAQCTCIIYIIVGIYEAGAMQWIACNTIGIALPKSAQHYIHNRKAMRKVYVRASKIE